MKKTLLLIISIWAVSLTALAQVASAEKPIVPNGGEILPIGYIGQVVNLAYADSVEVAIVTSYDELVFRESRRLGRIDSVRDIYRALKEIDVSFSFDNDIYYFSYVVKVLDKKGNLLFLAEPLISIVEMETDGVNFSLKETKKIEIDVFRNYVDFRKIDLSYALDEWGQAWRVEHDRKGLVYNNKSFFQHLIIETEGKSLVYNVQTGELEQIVDYSLSEGINISIPIENDNPDTSSGDVLSGTAYHWDLNRVWFSFSDFVSFDSSQYKTFVTYDTRVGIENLPWITFAENTGQVWFSVRDQNLEIPRFMWSATLDEIRKGKGFEVVPYVNTTYWPAPIGKVRFWWFQY